MRKPSEPAVPIVRLALLYAALFFDLGINLPFFPIWLRSNSLDAEEIGIILAAPLVARLIANPLVTDIADRHGAVAPALALSATFVLAGTSLLIVTGAFLPILAIVFLIGFAQGPLIALTDAFTWAKLREHVPSSKRERAYGHIRLWGSVGFIAASLGAGHLLDRFQPALIVWLLAGAAAVLAVTALSVGRSDRDLPNAVAPPSAYGAPRWQLASVIVGAALIQASHAAYYAFSSIHWAATGRSGTEIGLLWSIGVTAEIVFLLLAGRFVWVVGGPAVVLTIGGAGAALRWAGMAIDPSLAALVVLQMLHAITFGATHLGSVSLISRLAPARLQARAQGWLAALWAGSMAALTALAGALYPHMGEGTYLLMAVVAIIGLAFALAAARMRTGSRASWHGETENVAPLRDAG